MQKFTIILIIASEKNFGAKLFTAKDSLKLVSASSTLVYAPALIIQWF